jgi:DNA-binding NarL/FixJ family response regulator
MDIRVVIFEDNNSLRNGLYQLIDGSEGYKCVGAFGDCSMLMKNIEETKPHVILMDIELPGISGIEAVKMLRAKNNKVKVLMQTIFEENDKIFQSILYGASGYILKNTPPARILEAIKETHEGGAPMSPSIATKVLKMVQLTNEASNEDSFDLSEREKEILSYLVKGMSYKLVADECFVSVDTVRGHIRNIYEKLHVHSKSEAVAKAIKGKLV